MLYGMKRDVEGTAYCGPVAVAVITGKPLSRVLDTFRVVMHPRKKNPPRIKSTHEFHISQVLRRLGWKVTRTRNPWSKNDIFTQPTLAEWPRRREGDDIDRHLPGACRHPEERTLDRRAGPQDGGHLHEGPAGLHR